jgi:GrpB-like predicted nucleotidyltransferase (UPF0157 family)
MPESLEQKVHRVLQDEIEIVAYNPEWPLMFADEKRHLLACLPRELLKRIEHFGSTAVPSLAAKPIVDMLIEVSSLDETRARVAPVLEAQGYDYFWRATHGEAGPPFYAWFIKRSSAGVRTHHLHFVESDFEHWERLLFRDYLIEHPDVARQYEELKFSLARNHRNDRAAYTDGKADFVKRVMGELKAQRDV